MRVPVLFFTWIRNFPKALQLVVFVSQILGVGQHNIIINSSRAHYHPIRMGRFRWIG